MFIHPQYPARFQDHLVLETDPPFSIILYWTILTGREWICDGILLTIMRSIRRTPACGLAAALLVGSLAFAQLRPAQFVEPLQFPTALPDPGWPIAASGDSTTTGTKILSLPTARRFM
jgi:hypothetical protein